MLIKMCDVLQKWAAFDCLATELLKNNQDFCSKEKAIIAKRGGCYKFLFLQNQIEFI